MAVSGKVIPNGSLFNRSLNLPLSCGRVHAVRLKIPYSRNIGGHSTKIAARIEPKFGGHDRARPLKNTGTAATIDMVAQSERPGGPYKRLQPQRAVDSLITRFSFNRPGNRELVEYPLESDLKNKKNKRGIPQSGGGHKEGLAEPCPGLER